MKKLDLTKHYLVVGLGATGLSCVRYLVGRGCKVSAIDSRENPANFEILKNEFPTVEVHLGSFAEDKLAQADVLVVSPGVPLKTPAIRSAIEKGAQISSDVALFLNEFTGRLAAITGSNAKSTVTQWLGEALIAGGSKTLIAGNIGVPVLDAVDEAFDFAVLELSSFQLELLTDIQADAAVILNISEDHMDRYDSLQSYRDAKLNIFRGAKQIVVNRDDPQTCPTQKTEAEVVSFGIHSCDALGYGLAEQGGECYLMHGNDLLLAESELALPGRHNTANALAVVALADALGNPREATLAALKNFSGLPYRCQLVGERDGVRFFNDSKATNVGSVLAALNGLANAGRKNIILLAGGQGKGQDFMPLKGVVEAACKAVYLFGEDKEKLHEVFPDAEVKNTLADSFAAAVKSAKAGDSILFSPACASFDQFPNYVARGKAFNQLVEGLL